MDSNEHKQAMQKAMEKLLFDAQVARGMQAAGFNEEEDAATLFELDKRIGELKSGDRCAPPETDWKQRAEAAEASLSESAAREAALRERVEELHKAILWALGEPPADYPDWPYVDGRPFAWRGVLRDLVFAVASEQAGEREA